jgi:hypothetical protein
MMMVRPSAAVQSFDRQNDQSRSSHQSRLRLPNRMPVPEVARHLVCSRCGAKNSKTYNPIWARPGARVGVVGHHPDFIRS